MACEWYLKIFKQLFILSFIATTVWFNPPPPPPQKKKNFSSGVLQSSQEKSKTTVMQKEKFGVNKVHYGLGENGAWRTFLAIPLTILYM